MPSTAAVPDVGTPMPDLALISPDGTTASLQSLRSTATTVLYFLRASSCPVCLRHARTLSELAETGALAGVQVVLIAPGGVEEARQLASRVSSPTVSAWSSGSGHAAVGLGAFLSVQHSGTFVVGADGMIRYRRTTTLPPRSFDRDELLTELAR